MTFPMNIYEKNPPIGIYRCEICSFEVKDLRTLTLAVHNSIIRYCPICQKMQTFKHCFDIDEEI